MQSLRQNWQARSKQSEKQAKPPSSFRHHIFIQFYSNSFNFVYGANCPLRSSILYTGKLLCVTDAVVWMDKTKNARGC